MFGPGHDNNMLIGEGSNRLRVVKTPSMVELRAKSAHHDETVTAVKTGKQMIVDV